MGYVVDYKKIQFLYQQAESATGKWQENIDALKTKVVKLKDSSAYEGQLADSMKMYLTEVHFTIEDLLLNIISDYYWKLIMYWNGYLETIDSGSDAYMSEEILRNASDLLQSDVMDLLDLSDEIAAKLRPVADIFSGTAPSTTNLEKAMETARQIALDLNDSIRSYEDSHKTADFLDMDDLISQTKTLIANQLSSKKRLGIDSYQPGMVSSVVDAQVINTAIQNMTDYQQQNEEAFNKALEKVTQYTQQMQEERDWVQWVVVGVAIAGSIALIAVTAGGATPLVCAAVGATSGLASAAVGGFADNYIANGYATSGMDWVEFGKDCTVGTVVGGITGYAGAVAQGTSVVQPLQKAGTQVVTGMIKNGTEGAIDIVFDVGEAVVKDRPGEEIKSIFAEDFESTLRKTASSVVSDAATGYVSGVHSANTADKSWEKKVLEGVSETTVKNAYYTGTDTLLVLGEGWIGIKDKDEVCSAVLDNVESMMTGMAKDYAGNIVDGATDNLIDDIDNTVGKSIAKGVEAGVSSATGDFTGGATRQMYEAATSDKEYKFDAQDIWENDMKGGTSAVKDAFNEGIKTAINDTDTAKQAKFNRQMAYYDKDGDGRIQTVNVGSYRVAKEEYDAAQKMAGKAGYEGKTAAEILGLDKDADISTRQYSFDANRLKKSDSKKGPTNVVKLATN